MAIKEQIVLEGVNKTGKAFGQVNKQLTGMKGKVGGLASGAGKLKMALGAAAGALAAFGIVRGLQGQIDQFDNLAKSARAAGSAATNEAFRGFQILQKAMAEAGIDAATFDRAMLQTSSRLQAGVEGQKSYQAITDKLGDSIRGANGELKSGDELLKTMVKALNEGTITTEDFAKVVGGRAGPLIQAQFASLNDGAGKLEATLKDVEQHSNIVDLEAANNAEKFNDTMSRVKDTLGKLMTDALTPLLPILVRLAEKVLANLPGYVEKVKDIFDKLRPTLKMIGAILSNVVFPALSLMFDIFIAVQKVIMKIVDFALPGLKKGFEVLEAVVRKIIEFFQGVADALGNIYDTAIKLKDDVVGVFGNMKDKISDTTKGLTDTVTGLFSGMYQKLVGGSIVVKTVDDIAREWERLHEETVNTTKTMTNEIEKEIDTSLGDRVKALRDSFRTEDQITTKRYKDDIKDLKDYYGNRIAFDEDYLKLKAALDKKYEAAKLRASKERVNDQFGIIEGGAMKELDLKNLTNKEMLELTIKAGKKGLADLAEVNKKAFELNKAMNIASTIMNTAAGVGKALAQGGIFGPFLAGAILAIGAAQLAIISQQQYTARRFGGPVVRGKSYITGEEGPELFTPSTSGTITPNNQLGKEVNINFNVQAVDAQSFNTALARQRDTIVAIVNEAVNDTGRRSITA